MSRYFTSPPPVYARNWANGQNLVESTKIKSHRVASKKVHLKEKKDKKKQKNGKLYLSTKQVSDESEQLEKSCLTEEHEQHHHVGYLSDGSQNSKKRRREASPSVECNIKATRVAGKPIRIRFVFKKPKEAEVVVPQVPLEDRVCSTSGTERPIEIISSSVSGYDEILLSTSLESDKSAVFSQSEKRKKHRTSKESRYSSLFDEPVVPSISIEEDDGWLLGANRQENVSTKSTINENVIMKSGASCFS